MDKLGRQLCRLTLRAGPATPRAFSSSARQFAPSAEAYPFSSTVQVLPRAPALPPQATDSLLRTLNAHLTSQHPNSETYLDLFSRRSKARLLPGSVLTVTSYSTPPTAENPTPATTVFSGVLIASRRRHQGRDTSIRLRNLVGRTGVEMSFKVFSPLIKDIKVVQRAETSGPAVVGKDGVELPRRKPALRAARRAKMYFVREQPKRLVSVAGIVRQAREKEAALASRKRR
ncbi:mitochondrial 54S ribosomal protein bL19m IMG1 [Sporobolomyces koalae]|uniref:mitochondrial 54S ribosomal protein bL19m IMG1 n=1 Tax=Sporobolomyces koalae TaxID=500713 RepID=UPI003177793B